MTDEALSRSVLLDRPFFARSALDVAPDLLGCILQVGDAKIRLTETEAYLADDEASHSFRGRTKRNDVMFGEPGVAYVYFIYGMYWCMNVVTGPVGDGQAVLIRGGIPVAGAEIMRSRRPKCRTDTKLANGPGKLALALGIDGRSNGLDLCSDVEFSLQSDGQIPQRITSTPRVGISKNADKHWRFVSEQHVA